MKRIFKYQLQINDLQNLNLQLALRFYLYRYKEEYRVYGH